MHVLKYFEFFRVEMPQQTPAFDIQSVPNDVDGMVHADLPLGCRSHFHMHVLKHCEFFRVEMG
jgi:hypothetical protein